MWNVQICWFNRNLINFLQTIKCLLIVPNPESALNEEAGKLLLENYDDYFQRAKMMTEIHARHCCKSDQQLHGEHDDDEADGCSSSKKAAPDKKVLDKKKEKLMKEKRKILKRLWSLRCAVLILSNRNKENSRLCNLRARTLNFCKT